MPQFSPREVRTAIASMSNPTAKSFAYTAELYLGVPKAASSGVISFSLAAGETRNISFPVTMPSAEGTYPVYLDIFVAGELIGAYRAIEDVVIVPIAVAEFVYVSPLTVILNWPLEAWVDIQNQGDVAAECPVIFGMREYHAQHDIWSAWYEWPPIIAG
ncbi:unnamed protein product, partial [marine sediment metagenome]